MRWCRTYCLVVVAVLDVGVLLFGFVAERIGVIVKGFILSWK